MVCACCPSGCRSSSRRPSAGGMAEAALDLFAPVLPVTDRVMRRVPDLVRRHPGLDARDVVHVATCQESGIEVIISPDRGFDQIPGLHRIDPADAPQLLL